jgi:putative addiction module antidote
MTKRLKITTIGNSAGIILPKELLARLNLVKGDVLSYTETPDGFNVRAADAEFDEQMKVMRDVMHDYRHALRELAK